MKEQKNVLSCIDPAQLFQSASQTRALAPLSHLILSSRLRRRRFFLGLFFLGLFFLCGTGKSHAQPFYGWGVGFGGFPGCVLAPGAYASQAVCSTPATDCNSVRGFFNPLSYVYVVQIAAPYYDKFDNYHSGLACSYFYFIPRLQPIDYSGPHIPWQNPKQMGGRHCPYANASATNDGSCKPPEDTYISPTGGGSAAEPIDIGSGNMFYSFTDYSTSGPNPLSFTRYYNSRDTFSAFLGVNWHSTFDRFIWLYSSSQVAIQRPDGQTLLFNLNGGIWTPDADVDYTLTNTGAVWTLTTPDDSVEIYTAATTGYAAGNQALLQTIQQRNGYLQSATYNSNNILQSVTDSYGRTLSLIYNADGTLASIATPDSTSISYGYTTAGGTQNLTSVTYPTSPASKIGYVYANSAPTLMNALTGVLDDSGNSIYSWTYDAYGRALTSQTGNEANANITTVTYDDTTGKRNVTNALGVTDTYTFATSQNMQKVTSISRSATSTTAAATKSYRYDSNGYVASMTDWNGNPTTFVNNAHGLPTAISQAVNSVPSVARNTTIAYDSVWTRLPSSIVTDGLTASFTYDGNGEQLTKTLTDTTTSNQPYATAGQTRTWTNTWSNFLLASVRNPNGNFKNFAYDSSGALTAVTDALKHTTQITSHSGGGLPMTIVDPNGVTTTLIYDGRQRLASKQISGSTGKYTTGWAFDPDGNLITATLPDGSFLKNEYDTAHRLTKTTDALGSYITYTLDALGDRTQTNIYKNDGTLTWSRSVIFDALGRELVNTTGAGQTTTKTYDANGNTLSVEDGLNHTTSTVYDALDRASKVTDANGGTTTLAYDSHDWTIGVTDANGNMTSYLRDGFGDVIEQISPDSGTSIFHYDAEANLISKTDALGIATNQTFDALDRPLTTTYPTHAAENVAYTYDQTGTGFSFGIGRLTSVADAAGSLTRTYEERGNLASEIRVNGTTTLNTLYTYDGVSRIASMTYPDGTLVTYLHDAGGYVSSVSAQLPGSSAATNLATLTHQPFGPLNGANYGNGIGETWTFDQSNRPTNIIDKLAGASLQNLTYGYDLANNVTSITDAVNASNSQTLGYDPLNRLTSAISGPGGYGSFSWSYDKVGNRLEQVQGGMSTTYGYARGHEPASQHYDEQCDRTDARCAHDKTPKTPSATFRSGFGRDRLRCTRTPASRSKPQAAVCADTHTWVADAYHRLLRGRCFPQAPTSQQIPRCFHRSAPAHGWHDTLNRLQQWIFSQIRCGACYAFHRHRHRLRRSAARLGCPRSALCSRRYRRFICRNPVACKPCPDRPERRVLAHELYLPIRHHRGLPCRYGRQSWFCLCHEQPFHRHDGGSRPVQFLSFVDLRLRERDHHRRFARRPLPLRLVVFKPWFRLQRRHTTYLGLFLSQRVHQHSQGNSTRTRASHRILRIQHGDQHPC